MPYRKPEFVNGEIYHLVIRRQGDQLLFKNIDDYYRGIFSIYEFNNVKPVVIRERRRLRAEIKKAIKANRVRDSETDTRDKLVEVLVFCFMPNHIHLLVKQLREGGIVKLMNKIGSGYSGYFKRKYNLKRREHFFAERFTAVHIKTEVQLKIVFVYIHVNPISLIEPNWKENGIKDPERAIKFLEEEYRWSSLFDYLGKKNFPSVTDRDFILEIMGGKDGCRELVEDWVRYKGKIKKYAGLALEQ